MDLTPVARILIIAGVALVAIGVILLVLSKVTPLGLGKLPGDISVKREHFTFYFPVVTCLVLSAVGTLVLWIVARLMRK